MGIKRQYFFKFVSVVFVIVFMQINNAHVAHGEDISQLLKSMMKEIETLKARVQRTEDVNAISNLINKFFYKDEATIYDDLVKYVAKKTPGVSVEIVGRGIFKGYDGAKRTMVDSEKYYLDLHAKGMRKTYPDLELDNEADGWLALWHTASPVIEVAGDGKTAKGVWSSIYLTSKTYDKVGAPESKWFWYKIAVDFVKEDGEWKIWHYYRQPRFGIQSYNSLVGGPPGSADGAAGAGAAGAGAASNPNEGKFVNGHPMDNHGTYADAYSSKAYRNGYSLTNSPNYWPEPPEPYNTFYENGAYVYPSKPVSSPDSQGSGSPQKK